MSGKHTVLTYSTYTVRHAVPFEMASHRNGYRMSGKHTVLTYSTYTKWLPIQERLSFEVHSFHSPYILTHSIPLTL